MKLRSMGLARGAALLAGLATVSAAPATLGAPSGGNAWQDCAYPSPSGAVVTHEACAAVSDAGVLRLAPGELGLLRFDDDGLAALQVGSLFFYVAADGRSAPVAGVEGHAVEFHEGLAPSPRLRKGAYKIGYIDKRLRLVIPARFDGGLDFSNGRAQVCQGCKVARDGDFAELQGGLWGCIDATGREVVPITQPSPDQLDCSNG